MSLKLVPGQRCPLCTCPAWDGRPSVTHDVLKLRTTLQTLVNAVEKHNLAIALDRVPAGLEVFGALQAAKGLVGLKSGETTETHSQSGAKFDQDEAMDRARNQFDG